MSKDSLTAGLEDYIEAIYIAEINQKSLKGVDIAKMMNISRASVSEALSKLTAKGLVVYKSHGSINLTPRGVSEAESVYSKHKILKNFFESVLSIPPDVAEINACKIEHIISQNVINEIIKFTQYCNKYPEIIDKYRREKDNEANLSDREIFRSAALDGKD